LQASASRLPTTDFLDEPFSALDFEMTLFIREKLQEANIKTGTTMMIVSHDLEDAVFLADQILLLTRRPTAIAALLNFDMPKPRLPEAISEPEFIRIKSEALKIFQEEMRK
jgi:NitT/TauT family transport system ATP-binding protein